MYKKSHAAPRHPQKSILLITLGALVLLVGVLCILQLTHTIHMFRKPPTPITADANTKGEPASKSSAVEPSTPSSGTPATQTQEPGDQKSDTGGKSTADLLAPYGNFVSDHHPNLSGQPAPNSLTSVCTTTPGATCSISFTKGSTTKTLAAQTTDRGGSAYWNWTLQTVGLTEGTWQIQARASLDSQTKTVNDAMQLVVSP